MFTQIRTSKENKEVVSYLTRKLNLGAENVIARIAFTYSISLDIKLELKEIQNSSGKEYSKSVLFGDNSDTYLGMVSNHYNLYKTDKDLAKYVKLHLDHGLQIINKELQEKPNLDGFDFLIEKIENSVLGL